MLWLVALALGLLAGILSGGRIDNFLQLRFQWPAVVIGAVLVREAILLTPLNQVEGAQWIYAVALAVIVLWTVWHFRRLPGVWLVTAGAGLNLIVILANGARMPVARALAGSLVARGHIGQYTLMGTGTRLGALADWIALPWFGAAYSPGDLVVAAGLALIGFLGTRARPISTSGSGPAGLIVEHPP